MADLHHQDDTVTLYTGDATDTLAELPDASVQCVVTSPPYWGLRDYGTGHWTGGSPACSHLAAIALVSRCRRCGAQRHDQQHGLEPTPASYIDRLRGVFAELHRVLADTGTVWLNLGDSYAAGPPGRTRDPMRASTLSGPTAAAPLRDSARRAGIDRSRSIPRKNLVGMPWRVAFALQQDGWILRNAIVWHKPNAMPESVRDRLSNRYEMIFLLTKQQRYHFDLNAIREPLARPTGKHDAGNSRGKNPGDVWSISTRPLREAHFAAFPIDIPLRCIAAGCPEDGIVLDPFSGAATTGLAAQKLGRSYIGIDLNPEFHDIALRRLGLQPDHRRAA